MEKAVEVLLPPQPDLVTSPPAAAVAEDTPLPEAAGAVDKMEEFGRRLQDIISAHGSAADAQVEAEGEETDATGDVSAEAEVSAIMQSLNKLPSAEEKLKHLVKKHASLAALQRCDRNKLQHRLAALLEQRRSSAAARSKLESLCRDLQAHYKELREENLQRCREDEQKRSEITCHFQKMLMEIQVQIEQHSTRNDKLCRENANLTDKLESLLQQCEQREESQEKINRHRDLQHQLTEAKLEQANALLADAEEKHKREKEYLLREAIDKTKKCFAMKEQELAMKKKLTLYSEKFDEFQATLAKSNEIYGHFKKEMEKMSEKMKKLEKESNVWKLRFENCNKALTDMIEERSEKGKEYDLFVLKIQKLEKLCRSLQDERKVLYDKIKDVRQANASLPAKIFGGSQLLPEEIKELQELQEGDPVLTEDMARLKEQQAKLQEFAASLLITAEDKEEEEQEEHLGPEEDLLASAFVQFQTKTQIKPEPVSTEPTPEEKPSPEPTPEEKPSPEPTPEEKPSPEPTPEEKPSPEPTPEEKPSPEPTPEEKPSPEPTPEEKPQQQPHLPPAEVLVQPVQPAEPPHVPTGAALSNPTPPAAASREAPKKKKKKNGKNVC